MNAEPPRSDLPGLVRGSGGAAAGGAFRLCSRSPDQRAAREAVHAAQEELQTMQAMSARDPGSRTDFTARTCSAKQNGFLVFNDVGMESVTEMPIEPVTQMLGPKFCSQMTPSLNWQYRRALKSSLQAVSSSDDSMNCMLKLSCFEQAPVGSWEGSLGLPLP